MRAGIQAAVGGIFSAKVVILLAFHGDTLRAVFPAQNGSRRTDHCATDGAVFLTRQIPGIAVGFGGRVVIGRLGAGGEQRDQSQQQKRFTGMM